LLEIVLLTVCSVAGGAHGWLGIEEPGRVKLDYVFKSDSFANVVSHLTSMGFGDCFSGWTQTVAGATAGEVIALDGKRTRGSGVGAGRCWARP
jgi:hypothetical protein